MQGDGAAGPAGLSAAGVLGYVGAADTNAARRQGMVHKGCCAKSTAQSMERFSYAELNSDGTHQVKFKGPAVAELLLQPQLPITAGGWRDCPGLTRLRAPGCYAYQVDAPAASTVIVFRAEGPKP